MCVGRCDRNTSAYITTTWCWLVCNTVCSDTLLAVGCHEATIALFDVVKGDTPLSTFNVPHDGHDEHMRRPCFSPVSGSSLLMTCGSWDSEVKLWDLSNTVASVAASGGGAAPPKLVGVLRGHTGGNRNVRFSGDGAFDCHRIL